MTQEFVYLYGSDEQAEDVQRRLVAEGFRVHKAKRMSGGIMVRVRTDTADEAAVDAAVAELGPDLKRGPGGAPSATIVGYRDGLD